MVLSFKKMNRSILVIVVVLLILVVFNSCGVYSHKDRMRYSFLKSYNVSDSLFLNDIICFGLSGEGFSYRSINVDRDSLSEVFVNSLAKLNLPVNITPEKIRIYNKRCINGEYVRKKNIDFECLKKLRRRNNNEYSILPIIELLFSTSYQTGSAGSSAYYVSLLSISIFIFKNDDVVYYKKMSHPESVDSEFHPYSYTDFNIPIPQKHWDGLVREVMKEYIERLE
jgi:hypothetical protein